ncbi:hypothetical protein T11_1285 [Trichinella zimbabwensis]|uniref:Uncharacterized protein n=1 Tax=Trichinella zimbabwensis TaxID=268475 RepID=A0A0V1HVX5_9BILA|nr:hypothetical protein T11_1285 [Trichinella zimbabwensis]
MAKFNECKKFCEFSKYLNKRGLESQTEKTHNLYSKTVKQVHQWSALEKLSCRNCPYCECSGKCSMFNFQKKLLHY